MELPKAIEIVTVMHKEQVYLLAPDGSDAVKLLIEAGERIQVGRNNPGTRWNDLLPGETLMPDFSPSADRKDLLRKRPLGRECG